MTEGERADLKTKTESKKSERDIISIFSEGLEAVWSNVCCLLHTLKSLSESHHPDTLILDGQF